MGISGFQTTFLIGGNGCGVILRKCSKYSSSQSGKPTKTLPIPLGSKLLPIGKFICIFFKP